jgi:hypothetical protein
MVLANDIAICKRDLALLQIQNRDWDLAHFIVAHLTGPVTLSGIPSLGNRTSRQA